jgi:hypothetical protein
MKMPDVTSTWENPSEIIGADFRDWINPNVEEAYVKNMHHLYWHAIKTVIPRYENEQQATKSAN